MHKVPPGAGHPHFCLTFSAGTVMLVLTAESSVPPRTSCLRCKEIKKMKLIRTVDAAGQVLCHDITQIIPGEFKGPRFRKGHIVQPEDIPVLLSIGK